jgi:hypothetical protein
MVDSSMVARVTELSVISLDSQGYSTVQPISSPNQVSAHNRRYNAYGRLVIIITYMVDGAAISLSLSAESGHLLHKVIFCPVLKLNFCHHLLTLQSPGFIR